MPVRNKPERAGESWIRMIVTLPDMKVEDIGKDRCEVSGILARFGINPLEVIVAVNGRVVPEDAVVGGSDRVRIIRITHGG